MFTVLLLLISLLAARAQDGGGSSQNGQTDFGLPESTDNCYCLEQEIGSASLNVSGMNRVCAIGQQLPLRALV